MTREEKISSESKYQRAAAEWVARYNRSNESGVTVHPFKDREKLNPLCEPGRITDVTFRVVGSYFYSERTYDYGDIGISYTLWEPTRSKKKGDYDRPVRGMEIRFGSDGMNAGRFIQECVELMS